MNIEQCTTDDFPSVRRLVDASETLTRHTSYTYWVVFRHWPELFLVAKSNGSVVGFTCGLITADRPDRAFLWQIGVQTEHRRQGIAEMLARAFFSQAAKLGATEICLTIEENNNASLGLFRKIAEEFNTSLTTQGTTGPFGGTLEQETVYSISMASARLPVAVRSVNPTDLVTVGVWAYFLSKYSWGWSYPVEPISEVRKADYIVGAYVGHEPAGFACVNRLASPDGKDNGQMWLSGWVVAPEFRNRGLGGRLLDECLKYMKSTDRTERMLLSTENTQIFDVFTRRGWKIIRNDTLNEAGDPTTIFELTR